MITFVFVY